MKIYTRTGDAGENEAAERRQLPFEPIDQAFEALDVGAAQHGLGDARRDGIRRIRELRAEGEKIALDVDERVVEVGVEA